MTSRLVCPSGKFELLCNTSGRVLEWTIDPLPDGTGAVNPTTRFIVSANHSEVQSIVISDSTILLVSRTSLSPLISQLEINNTIVALNGTRIDCATQDGTVSTVITIIRNGKTNA